MIVIIIVVIAAMQKGKGPAMPTQPIYEERHSPPRRRIRELFGADPYFSLVVFDDFVVAIYTEIRTRLGENQLPRMAAYLADHAPSQLQGQSLGGPVTNVIVGAARLVDIQESNGSAIATIEIESNLQAAGQAWYLREQWVLRRSLSAKSRSPEKARSFDCPSCGAPQGSVVGGRCNHCGQAVGNGAFDWAVVSAQIVEREQRGPMLTGNTVEQGTDRPTIVDAELNGRFADLRQRDPAFDDNAFQGRVNLVFTEFQTAWAVRDLAKMRPWFTDAFFGVQKYWVDEYLRQHLRNVTENARILRLEWARIESDGYFDAITVRIFATSLDYTLRDQDNQIVSGNRSNERVYSEYWTFIRGRDAKGPARVDKNCPKCGAPLDLEMAGTCKYCRTHITTGTFDWVLSRIEQDDVYEG
jgi:predicted RNA-binding Zn-ribbon protein involved in translation (DUF1610 family)